MSSIKITDPGKLLMFESSLWQIIDPLSIDNVVIDDNVIPIYNNFISKIGVQLNYITKTKYNNDINIENKIIPNDTMDEFVKMIYSYSSPNILKYRNNIQQMYILYLISLFFKKYNQDYLEIDNEIYINRIYYPNIINLSAKHALQAKNFLNRIIRFVCKSVETKTKNSLDYQSEFFGNNQIPTIILHLFLTKVIYKFDPLELTNPDTFYTELADQVLRSHLKKKSSDFFTIEDENEENESARFRIYKDALQASEIELACLNNVVIRNIAKRIDNLNYTFLNNEIQRLFTLAFNCGYTKSDSKSSLIGTQMRQDKLKEMRKRMPQIYKILSSICIKSDRKPFLKTEINTILNTVYNCLYNKYKNDYLSNDHLKPIIYKIAKNLVISITKGEFIDIYTLNKVNISFSKFNQQLEDYLNMILEEIESYLQLSKDVDNEQKEYDET